MVRGAASEGDLSGRFRVQILETMVPGWGPMLHVKVRRIDSKNGITWDEMQAIKNEYVGPEALAFEVFPRASELVDEAPIRHLWVLLDDRPLPNLARR